MHIVTKINEWQLIKRQLTDKKIGFVPTMGHLHAGHASLCERSMLENEMTVVSIFVNPAQFNQENDFVRYPRSLENDKDMLSLLNIDYLFLPEVATLYPDDYQIHVMETALSQLLEGECRPGHFQGMLTVVLKLFHLIQPANAYFGEKDYQQLLLVKKMAHALFLPIQVIACQTIRAEDGLALSSRNSRLTPLQRQQAAHFPRLLSAALRVEEVIESLQSLGFIVDYVVEKWQRRLGAVWIEDVRLIDNVSLESIK